MKRSEKSERFIIPFPLKISRSHHRMELIAIHNNAFIAVIGAQFVGDHLDRHADVHLVGFILIACVSLVKHENDLY